VSKKTIIILLVIIISMGLFNCFNKENKLSKSKGIPKFEVYLVKEESEKGALSYGRNEYTGEYVKAELALKDLTLEENPIFTDKDIEKYYWRTHTIELTKEYLKNHSIETKKEENYEELGSKLLGLEEFDAVVIVCNGQRIYCAGVPFSMRWSWFPPEIVIKDINEKSIIITKNGNNKRDVRENKDIYKTLKGIGILLD
jgi:hypothetical protein